MPKVKITLTIDPRLAAKIERYRGRMNLSALAAEAFEREVAKLEDVDQRAYEAERAVIQAGSKLEVSNIRTMYEDAFKKNLASVFESVLANTPDYAKDSVQAALNSGTAQVWNVRRVSGR